MKKKCSLNNTTAVVSPVLQYSGYLESESGYNQWWIQGGEVALKDMRMT